MIVHTGAVLPPRFLPPLPWRRSRLERHHFLDITSLLTSEAPPEVRSVCVSVCVCRPETTEDQASERHGGTCELSEFGAGTRLRTEASCERSESLGGRKTRPRLGFRISAPLFWGDFFFLHCWDFLGSFFAFTKHTGACPLLGGSSCATAPLGHGVSQITR